MADQKINALPTKTTPTSGDKCLMSGAAEEYLIDYDKLATAILNKLTSKTFTLDQGTKTLIAAVNELNSKSSKTTASAVIKAYNKIKDELWETWENGTFIKTADINGPRYYAIGYKIDNNFGAFIMLYYAYDRPLYARVSSGVWDVDNPKNI